MLLHLNPRCSEYSSHTKLEWSKCHILYSDSLCTIVQWKWVSFGYTLCHFNIILFVFHIRMPTCIDIYNKRGRRHRHFDLWPLAGVTWFNQHSVESYIDLSIWPCGLKHQYIIRGASRKIHTTTVFIFAMSLINFVTLMQITWQWVSQGDAKLHRLIAIKGSLLLFWNAKVYAGNYWRTYLCTLHSI